MPKVRYEVPLVAQTKSNTCWAACATMLWSWANERCYRQRALVTDVGMRFDYDKNLSVSILAGEEFVKAWGLVKMEPQCFAPRTFLNLLKAHGPMIFFAAVNLGQTGKIAGHARVVTGFDTRNDLVYINDPWEKGMRAFKPGNKGHSYAMRFDHFMRQVAKLATPHIPNVTEGSLGLTVIAHLPAGKTALNGNSFAGMAAR